MSRRPQGIVRLFFEFGSSWLVGSGKQTDFGFSKAQIWEDERRKCISPTYVKTRKMFKKTNKNKGLKHTETFRKEPALMTATPGHHSPFGLPVGRASSSLDLNLRREYKVKSSNSWSRVVFF